MNIYLFLSGLFLIALSAIHAVFGEINVFRAISQSDLDAIIQTSVYVPWHQLTFILLLSGAAQVFVSFNKKYRVLSLFVLIVVVGNLLIFLGISAFQKNWFILQNSVPQYILFAIVIVLLAVGIKKKTN